LIDYPGKIASTIFLGGCNFRCPFCHNKSLVTETAQIQDIPVSDILNHYQGRRQQLEGICISGGEPTLFAGLYALIKELKAMGYAIKLDTNGTNPVLLNKLLQDKLLDYIAMDIKAAPSLYNGACGVSVNMETIRQSISLLQQSGIDHEFRTTVVPEFFPESKLDEVIELIHGSKKYFLQQFHTSSEIIEETFQTKVPYSLQTLQEMAERIRLTVPDVQLRGVV
jgi:pyruvate formate lyase activating enzyme